jgi:hypothetical protein
MSSTEKTVLLISLIPIFMAAVAFTIHMINRHRHNRRNKQTQDSINRIR